MIYKTTFTVRDIQADPFGLLRPSALLEMAQEVATCHATRLGVGRAPLEQRDLFWAVARQTVSIARLPAIGETILVETWPGEPTRTAFPRHILATDAQGQPLFQVTALWLFMNRTTRTMVLPKASGLTVPGITRGLELPLPSSLQPTAWEQQTLRTVRYSELDQNGHLNNTRYASYLEDLLPLDFHRNHRLEQLHISYTSEALADQELTLHHQMEESTLSLSASRLTEGVPHWVFSMKARYGARP